MTIFGFKHPSKDLVYTWHLEEGLIYKNGSNPASLDRSTSKGELLYRLLQYKTVDRWGRNHNADDCQTEITTRTYIPKIMEILDPEADRSAFIRTIHGFGYEWLLEVEIAKGKLEEVAQGNNEPDEKSQFSEMDLQLEEIDKKGKKSSLKGHQQKLSLIQWALLIYALLLMLIIFAHHKNTRIKKLVDHLNILKYNLLTYNYYEFKNYIKHHGHELLEGTHRFPIDFKDCANKWDIEVDNELKFNYMLIQPSDVYIHVVPPKDPSEGQRAVTLTEIAAYLDRDSVLEVFVPIDLLSNLKPLFQPFEKRDAQVTGFSIFRDQPNLQPKQLECHITIKVPKEHSDGIIVSINPIMGESILLNNKETVYTLYLRLYGKFTPIKGQHFSQWIYHSISNQKPIHEQKISKLILGHEIAHIMDEIGNMTIDEAITYLNQKRIAISAYSIRGWIPVFFIILLFYFSHHQKQFLTSDNAKSPWMDFHRTAAGKLSFHSSMFLPLIANIWLSVVTSDRLSLSFWIGVFIQLGCLILIVLIYRYWTTQGQE